MDQDDDGVGYVAEGHYLKSTDEEHHQAMSLLQLPSDRNQRGASISSSITDIDAPIYSTDNLTRAREHQVSVIQTYKKQYSNFVLPLRCWFLLKQKKTT